MNKLNNGDKMNLSSILNNFEKLKNTNPGKNQD